MDHAKALADALRPIAALADGYEDSLTGDFIVGVALARLRDAQMALDAHPAEAATRENGKEISPYNIPMDRISKAARGMFIDNQKNPPATNDMFEYSDFVALAAWNEARLSTHQQQGVDYANGFYDGWMRCGCFHIDMNFEGREEEKANIAARLPRAPQPDTVTELVKRDCLYKPCGYPTCKCVGIGIDARELTAALAIRGKVG